MASQTILFDVNIDSAFNQFVAVGAATRSQTSLDGITWTAKTLTSFAAITDLAYGNNILVGTAATANNINMIYTTPSAGAAADWTIRSAAATGAANIGWQAIAFGNNMWVAISGGLTTTVQTSATMVLWSTNSTVWTMNTNLTAADWRCITYAESKFVTLSYGSNLVRYSTDGVTWSNGSGLPYGRWKSIAYDATLSRFVAVAVMPAVSVGGSAAVGTLQFTGASKTITRGTGNFSTDLYIVGQKIVITGTSANNGTFTIATVGTTTMTVNEAVTNEGPASAGTITTIEGSAYSDDGITWAVGSPSPYLLPSQYTSVASNGLGRFVAVSNTSTSQVAAYSDDGISWTPIALPLISQWGCVAYGNGRWIILSQSVANVLYSADGATWSVGPSNNFAWIVAKWVPFPVHSNDTITIDRGATLTVNTDQKVALSAMTITDGTLLIKNTSTSTAIRFATARTSGTTVQAITPASGLGSIVVEGNWIQVGIGDGSSGQSMTVPYTDYVSALWVETGVGTGVYEIWLNVSGAYGGTLRQYQDGLLDVSTGQRGKFFTQTPSSTQDKYITALATTTFGMFNVTMDSTAGIFRGAQITGQGIPANTIIEEVIDANTVRINQLPVSPGSGYAVLTGYTLIPVRIFNPLSSQFTSTVVFGDGTNGNVLTNGVKVRIPNIMITSDTPVNLYGNAGSLQLGQSWVMTAGGVCSMDICLHDEAYHNFTQAKSLTITNTGMHTRPLITKCYELTIDGLGLGMPAARRTNSSNIWLDRDKRDTLQNGLALSYVSFASINNVAMVLQSAHAITAGTLAGTYSMLGIANSDYITVSNIRAYSLNETKQFHYGIGLSAPVTYSDFTNIEYYGGPMLASNYSRHNTFTNLINSETMFSHSHNYTAGMRVTHDPITQADMVADTIYYFKTRTFFTRDRTEYTESRVYSATPFKGSTYYPDYINAYVNAPQSVTFGWTHRVPSYTHNTSPLSNADAKNFLEIYRDTSAVFTPALSKKVAGFNNAPSISIPTIVAWATETRSLTFTGISVSASGGRTMTFSSGDKTIVASSGSFVSDGFVIGDKVAVTSSGSNNFTYTVTNVAALTLTVSETPVDEAASEAAVLKTNKIVASSGSFVTDGFAIGDKVTARATTASSNNGTFTISNVVALVINVTETIVTQAARTGDVSIVAKYTPTPKIVLLATVGRSLKFDGISMTAAGGRTLTFGGTVALPSQAPTFTATGGRTLTFTAPTTISCSSGSFISDGFLTGDKIYITGTTSNNTMAGNFFTIAGAVGATSMTVTAASDLLITEGPLSSLATIRAMRTTITCSSGSFSADGFIVGDRVRVSGTTYNNTTGSNNLIITAVAATMLTFSGDYVFPEGPLSSTATLAANRLTGGSGSFVTDGYAPGDIITVSGSANAGNNKTFTLAAVFSATVLNIVETVVTNAAETSGATLTVKTMPIPKAVYLSAHPNRELAFQRSVAQAAATTRILTFDGASKTITASGTTPGNFITDGFVVGDKVIITNTTNHNGVIHTLTAVTATVLTASAAECTATEVSTTATLTATRIKATTGSFINDSWAVGDAVTISGTVSSNGTYYVVGLLATYLFLCCPLTGEAVSYTGSAVITATKLISRQQIYFTSARTLATTAANKTLTASSGSYLQDGYIVGDKVLVNGTPDTNHIYTISTLTATILTFLEAAAPTSYTANTNAVSWVHTGQRPSFTTTATITLAWTAATKTLTLGSGTFNGTYNFQVGDRLFITGQKYNNGMFTIATIPGATLTVNEPVVVDTTTYNATLGTVSTVYGYHVTQKVTVTAAAARVMTFDNIKKACTLSGASAGSFLLDGYAVGDCVQVAGTAGGLNDGYFTISALSATVMNFNELIVNATYNSGETISAPNIVDDTDYYYKVRKYDTATSYTDSPSIYVKSSAQETITNVCLRGTSLVTDWAISNGTDLTVGAATRVSPFVSSIATQTADALIVTSNVALGTLTQSIPTAVGNAYTFSIWVCTQPSVLKMVGPTPGTGALTATAGRTLKFDNIAKQASGGRTFTFASGAKTIVGSSGDFTTDGFAVGDKIKVTGSASNNFTYTVTIVVALTITVSETPVDENLCATCLLTTNKLTAAGASPGSFLTDGYEIGDRVLFTGVGTTYNAGWFTITNVVATILNFNETVYTEVAATANLTMTNYHNDTLTVAGTLSLGTANQAFTATAQWQKVSVTFTATGTSHNAVIKITSSKRQLCIIGAMVNLGSTALPYLTTTTVPVYNINKVRDISLLRAWCRGYGDPVSHSGIEPVLSSAVTGELWTEVYCGTTSGFTPTFRNKVFDTWAGSGNTIVFNNESSDNVLDGFTQTGIGAPTNLTLAYFAVTSSNNKVKNLTYNLHGTLMTGLAAFLTESDDTLLYNWNISNWRNYASTVGNAAIFTTTNAISGVTVENLIMNNSDLPIQNAGLNMVIKGMSGGNVKPLNSALLYNMPVTPVYTLPTTIAASTNFDSVSSSLTATNYVAMYDTIFNELYFTSTTGALHILFNASKLVSKPYALTGTASFDNRGRLYMQTADDSVEYTWPHLIMGVSGFRNEPLLLNGVDLGNTLSLLQGLLVQYKINTGSGYPANWTDATPANLAAESVSASTGFYLKIKITAKAGMKYSTMTRRFVEGEKIRGTSSQATATVLKDFYYPVQGTVWLSNIVGTFSPGETIVKDSNGEARCINVATNTTFALFPSFSSYIDGLQIYTTVDQTAKYPPEQTYLTLSGLQSGSEVRIYTHDTTTRLSGIESSGTSFEYSYTYSAGVYVDIVVFHLDYKYYRIDNYLLLGADSELSIEQIPDSVYYNPV